MGHLPDNWIQKLCVLLSVPGWLTGDFYGEIIRLFEAWAAAEGGEAKWDPLNTTDHVTDAFGKWQGVNYNGIGVANYTTPFHGIVATAATLLESSQFTGIVADLRSAKRSNLTAEQIVNRNTSEIKQWGTNPKLMLQILSEMR